MLSRPAASCCKNGSWPLCKTDRRRSSAVVDELVSSRRGCQRGISVFPGFRHPFEQDLGECFKFRVFQVPIRGAMKKHVCNAFIEAPAANRLLAENEKRNGSPKMMAAHDVELSGSAGADIQYRETIFDD